MRSSANSRKRILSGQGKNPPSLSSSPPATRNFNVPDLLSRHFVGRKDILIGLHKCLVGSNDRSRPRRAALWGLPGVGKSQVALRYAQDTSPKYKHVFHIRADSKSQLISDYRVVAELLRLIDREEEANADEQLIIKTVNQWLTNTPEWLLIFDNVCDLRALRQILPTAGTGDMLFTTRDSDTARSLGNPEADFEVKPLSSDYAVELVGKFVKPDIMDERMVATARALHQLVDGLPIAIEQTVTLAGLRKVTLEQMVQQLQKRRQVVMDQRYQTSLHEIHSSTGALFAMATESLTSRNPEAAALFKIMIYLDTTAIPIELLEEGGSRLSQYFDRIVAYDRGAIRTAKEEQMRANQLMNGNRTQSPRYPWKFTRDVRNLFRTQESPRTVGRADSTYDISLQDFVKEDRHIRDVLEATNRIDHALLDLQTAGLIQIYNTRTVTIHDLVRDLNVEMLTPKTTASNQAQPHLAMTLVYLAFPVPQTPNRFANFDKCTLYHPHASSVLHHCKGFLNDTTAGPDLMHIVASVLHSRHQSKPSSFSSSDEEQSPRKAYHLAYSGYMRSWSRLRAQVPDLAIAHEARADFTLELRGAVYNRIVSTYERFGQAPRRAIDTALKLGFLAASDKDYPDAKKWISAAAKGYKGLLGPEHDLTFDTMGFLIHVLSDMHAYEDALDVALNRVDLCKSRFGPLRLSMDGAVCSAALGKLYRRLGHADVAVEWYLVSLRGVECIYGSDSTVLPATLLILASLSRELHRYEKAVEYASRGHDLLNGEDENHMRKNEIRCELALCLEGVGKNPEAMELLRETLTALLPGYTMDAYRKLLELLQPLVLKAVWDFVRLGMGEGGGDFSGGVDGDLIFEAEWVHGVLGLD